MPAVRKVRGLFVGHNLTHNNLILFWGSGILITIHVCAEKNPYVTSSSKTNKKPPGLWISSESLSAEALETCCCLEMESILCKSTPSSWEGEFWKSAPGFLQIPSDVSFPLMTLLYHFTVINHTHDHNSLWIESAFLPNHWGCGWPCSPYSIQGLS